MKHRPRILGTINLAKTLKSKARVPDFPRLQTMHFIRTLKHSLHFSHQDQEEVANIWVTVYTQNWLFFDVDVLGPHLSPALTDGQSPRTP